MVAQVRTRAQRHDLWVTWMVVGLFVVALLLGWAVRTAAEGRTVSYEAGGLRLRYPAGWVRANAQPPILLQAEKWVAPFRNTLTLQVRPLPQGAARPFGAIQQALALERARTWMAYRVLGTEEAANIGRRTGSHVTFAYVETNANPFVETIPVVMRGEEYLLQVGDQVQIVTLTAAEDNYVRAQKDLRAFVRFLAQ